MTDATPTLYTSPGSQHCRRVLILAHELGIELNLKPLEVRPVAMGAENAQPAFLRLNPNGKVPVLERGDLILWESNAIMWYLAETHGYGPLWPADPVERAKIARWQVWQAAHLSAAADGLLGENGKAFMGMGEPDPARIEALHVDFHRFAGVLDGALADRDYLECGRLTCADIAVATALMHEQMAKLPIDRHERVRAWLDRIHARDSWKATAPPPMPGM